MRSENSGVRFFGYVVYYNANESEAERGGRMSRYKCIQRVGANRQTTLEKILDSIRRYPGAWDGVALFTPANFNDTPEESQRKYEAFEPQVRAVQALGLPVQFNIGYLLGHGDFQSGPPALPRHMVGPEGETCRISVCPRSRELHEKAAAVFARFARLGPECIWIDDDFRVYDHQPVQCACFCDECVAGFNREYGHAYSREELNEALLEDRYPEENELRREWLRYTHEGMKDLLRDVAQAVHAVNPEIVMGLMVAGAEYNVMDLPDYRDYGEALKNPAGKVYFRPGAFFYSDKTPFECVEKAFAIAVTNANSLTDTARAYSEIVICPYVKRGKSHKITAWEAALHIGLGGCDGVTFEAVKDMIDEMNGYIERMDRERPFLEALSESLQGRRQVGFYPYFSQEQWVYAKTARHLRQTHSFPFALSRQLLRIGAPLTPWRENALGVILAGDLVKAMPREELEAWLGKAVYADGEAARLAEEKLGRPDLGVEVLGEVSDNLEIFTDHPLNRPWEGFLRGGHWAGYGQGCADMRCAGAEALTRSQDPNAPDIVGAAVYETPEGGRSAVLARAPWSDDILSFPKSCQILNILDWLCGGLPVRIDTDCRIGQALWEGEKDTVCFLFSMDFDDAESVRLRLKKPARALRLDKTGAWRPVGQGKVITLDRIEAFTCAPVKLVWE